MSRIQSDSCLEYILRQFFSYVEHEYNKDD